jgi:hypothetical protein
MNPFKLEADDTLYRIASGAAAPPDIKSDIMKAESVGEDRTGIFQRGTSEEG